MRALTVVVLVGVASMLVVGCGPKKEELPPLEPADVQAAKTAPPGAPPAAPVRMPVMIEPAPPAPIARPKAEKPQFDKPPVEPAAPAGAETYTIKAGDTLYTLAKRFYGDGKLWTRIADANKDKIKDVSHIPIGTVLTIPPK